MTKERANAIYYRDYWIKPKINLLPDELANIVFDHAVVQGQPTAVKNLQRALKIKDDGIIGKDTLEALSRSNYNSVKTLFIKNVNNIEDKYIANDPSQKIFENGHRNRFNRY